MKRDVYFPKEQMFISVDELKESGYSYYKINQMVEDGALQKLTKKYYENINYVGKESNFYYVSAYAPKGVICLMSAAAYHNLTSERMDTIDVAIQRKSKISTLPVWPEFTIYYYTKERFEAGIQTVQEGKNSFKVYDVEKTVADIVFYREKVGIDETKKVMVNYLKRKDRELNRLIHYAELLKCGDTMKKYLEVLV